LHKQLELNGRQLTSCRWEIVRIAQFGTENAGLPTVFPEESTEDVDVGIWFAVDDEEENEFDGRDQDEDDV
jgi:hypothetical protein